MLPSSDLDDVRQKLDQCLRLAKHTTDREVARTLRALAEEYRARLRSIEKQAS